MDGEERLTIPCRAAKSNRSSSESGPTSATRSSEPVCPPPREGKAATIRQSNAATTLAKRLLILRTGGVMRGLHQRHSSRAPGYPPASGLAPTLAQQAWNRSDHARVRDRNSSAYSTLGSISLPSCHSLKLVMSTQ